MSKNNEISIKQDKNFGNIMIEAKWARWMK
jgi:hypothetical protein